MPYIPTDVVNLTGVIALVAGIFWMLSRGTLKTWREVDELRKAYQLQIDTLRTESDRKDAVIARKDDQIERLMVIGQTVTRVLDALEDLAQEPRR